MSTARAASVRLDRWRLKIAEKCSEPSLTPHSPDLPICSPPSPLLPVLPAPASSVSFPVSLLKCGWYKRLEPTSLPASPLVVHLAHTV